MNRQVLSYDERGNLVEDRQGRRAFTYDVTNRMTGFIKNGKLRASYAYNHQGQRIRKTLHGNGPDKNTTLYMAYAPGGVLLSEHGRNSHRQRTFARDYVWLGTRPIAQIERRIRPNGTTARARVSYIHTDHLSTPEFATDDTGTEVWRWNRDAYGVGPTLRDTDRNGIRVSINLRFPGQYHDRESGLFYNHHRDYDPHLGRYIQSDPIGLNGGINRYAYVKGNPVNYIDPTGLVICDSTNRDTCEDEIVTYAERHSINSDDGAGLNDFTAFGGFGYGSGTLYAQVGPLYPPTFTLPYILIYGPHEYEFEESNSCSADEALEFIRQAGNSAPGAPYAREGSHRVVLFGRNPIMQTVNLNNRTIRNETLQGHIFDEGFVHISIISTGADSSTVNVRGEGYGLAPAFNNLAGDLIFRRMLDRLSAYCAAN